MRAWLIAATSQTSVRFENGQRTPLRAAPASFAHEPNDGAKVIFVAGVEERGRSHHSPDGTVSFRAIDPGFDSSTWIFSWGKGKWTLKVREGQSGDVFEER